MRYLFKKHQFKERIQQQSATADQSFAETTNLMSDVGEMEFETYKMRQQPPGSGANPNETILKKDNE